MGVSNAHYPNRISQSCVNATRTLCSADGAVADSKCSHGESKTSHAHEASQSGDLSLNKSSSPPEDPPKECCVVSGPQVPEGSPSPNETMQNFGEIPMLPLETSFDTELFCLWFSVIRARIGFDDLVCFDAAQDTPPISSSSLAELEINSIIGNPKLRHDINFDHELHFRPNNDGEQGRLKEQVAVDYWRALEIELKIYIFMLGDPDGSAYRWTSVWTHEFRKCQKRIPKAFAAIREILLAMAPDRDRSQVEEALDVGLIMQQIEHGSADLASMAVWLATFLKRHCAPVRDKWVDQMVRLISRGMQASDAGPTVKGLKTLFGILEAMKLVRSDHSPCQWTLSIILTTYVLLQDIANHQIRHLRPVLLNATTHFEQVYNEQRIETGQVDVDEAMRWYSQPLVHIAWPYIGDSQLIHFIHCLIWTLLPVPITGPPYKLPQIFRLDYERLRSIRTAMISLIREEICVSWIRQQCSKLGYSGDYAEQLAKRFRHVSPIIIGTSSWQDAHENLVAELVRLVSPTSKAASTSSNGTARSQADQNRCLDRPAFSRWLRSSLSDDSEAFRQNLDAIRENIVSRVLAMAKICVKLSPMEMFEALVPGRRGETCQTTIAEWNKVTCRLATTASNGSPNCANNGSSQPLHVFNEIDRFEDICRRTTHIAALHWIVWAPILYLNNGRGSDSDSSDVETESAPSADDSVSQDEDGDCRSRLEGKKDAI